MNLFKKMVAAIFGSGKRKTVNFNAVNEVPPVGNNKSASRSGRSSFSWGSNGKRYRNKMQQFEENRNRWKTGGTGSWSKSHAGKSDNNKGGQGESLRLLRNDQKQLKKYERHIASLEKQQKNKGAIKAA